MKARIETQKSAQLTHVVRVAVANNFNCTDAEYQQVDGFAHAFPHKFFFINSSIRTPALMSINDHPYPAVVTVNPDLVVDEDLVNRIYALDPQKISFLRVKWLPFDEPIKDLALSLSMHGYKVVLTLQRWNSKNMMAKYTAPEWYKYNCSRFRLCGMGLMAVHYFCDDNARMYICDRENVGCGGCGLCSKLNTEEDLKLESLNLSSSGICPNDCPDCYAKTMQNFLIKTKHPPIRYDHIKPNRKQAGKTGHIRRAIKNAKAAVQ